MTETAVATLEQRFLEFHEHNPRVYERLVALAREAKRRGHDKLGISMLYEVVRWELTLSTEGDPFRLNNNWRAFYARRIMAEEPDLRDIFSTREQRFDGAAERLRRAVHDGRLSHDAAVRGRIIHCPTARRASDFPVDAIATADVAIGAGDVVLKERHGPGGRRVATRDELAGAEVIAPSRGSLF